VISNSAVALGLALYGSFAGAASLSVVTRLGIFALTCAALPMLRLKGTAGMPSFRVPGGHCVAGAGVLFCLWLLATRSLTQIWQLLLILAAGLLVRGLVGHRNGRELAS